MMTRQGIGLLAGVMGAALVLAGCQTGTSPFAKKDAGATATPNDAQGIVTMEKDVEAPETFSLSGEGLWDGRPSLGGVWVAHASVKDPERVLVRNAKNGKSVVGALFRRERENPGPSLQVSSDAAEALGMLAGQPTEISVVALKRQELDLTTAAEVTPATEDAAGNVETIAPAAIETGAVAATSADEGVAATETAASEDMADVSEAAPETKKRSLFGGLFKRKPKVDDAMADGADTAAPIADTAGAGAIEQAPLDPVVGTAAAGIAEAESRQAAAPATVPTLKRAYVQIGIFSSEANASTAVGQMKQAGMTATVVPDQSNGKTYWRVIVGPAASVGERDALAGRVKGIGYPDAYPVSK
jgi:cell division septation protein DedD